MVSWFINSPFEPYTSSDVCLSRNSSRPKVILIACPAASLRSVRIRRHRSLTRGIIAVFSSKHLLDFRRTHSLTFPQLPGAGKLDLVFRVFVSDFIEDAKAFCSRHSVDPLSGAIFSRRATVAAIPLFVTSSVLCISIGFQGK